MSKLFQKLALVQSQLKAVPENGHNKFHGYSYATHQDIVNSVRPICSANGLFISVTCSEHTILKDGKAASVVVELIVTDCESGESTSFMMPGYAEDSKSDKSLWKALTGATKYALRSLFCLASGDDPELEDTPESVPTKPVAGSSDGKAHKTTVHTLQSSDPAATNGKMTKPVTGNGNAAPRPPQSQPTPPSSPAANNNGGLPPSILEQTTEQMRRIGWTIDQGRRFLQETFGVLSRKHLTAGQLRQFLDFLRSLPTPERVPVPS